MKPIHPSLPTLPDRLLSVVTVAELLDVSSKSVRRLVKQKAIRIHRIGRQIRISEGDLAAFIRGRREG